MTIPLKQIGTWKWGILCLCILAPFFFLTYGFANQYAAGLISVPSIVFDWEKHIPLWSWTIVPYWSIDLFYGLSLLLCWNKIELKQHALRLFSAQLISISCFLLFPLKFSFERPELHGFFGIWFDILMGFDKPFNQAPSLHIVLLVILWDFYRRHVSSSWKWCVDFWAFLIGISVLTTWQHHFIDIPTGLWVGAFCIWCFPITTKSLFRKDVLQTLTFKHLKIGMYYLIAAIIFSGAAFIFRGIALCLLYPAMSLLLIAIAYFAVKPNFFQKESNGKLSYASYILFAPYLLFAWLNSRFWTKKHAEDSKIIHIENITIYLGRIPNTNQTESYQALFDCCAELPLNNEIAYQQYLSLDLIPLQANQLEQAVTQFDMLWDLLNIHQPEQKLLIFCALGYSRSSAILAAWLLKKNVAKTAHDAVSMIQTSRPWIVLHDAQLKELTLYQLKFKGLAP